MRFFFIVCISCIVSVLSAFGQGQQKAPRMERSAFEKLLMERATYGTTQTDFGESYALLGSLFIPARFLDRRLYERALTQYGATHPDGECGKTAGEHLACAARKTAFVAAATAHYAEALILSADAVEFAERIVARSPGYLADAALALSRAEWQFGSVSRAETAFAKAADTLRKHPKIQTPERKTYLSLMRARFADADLRDTETLSAMSDMISANLAMPAGFERDDDQHDVDELIDLHLGGRVCPNCGRPVAAPVLKLLQRKIDDQLKDPSSDKLREIVIRTSGLTAADLGGNRLERLARLYLNARVSADERPRDHRSILPRGTDDIAAARIIAASTLLSSDHNISKAWLSYFTTGKGEAAVQHELAASAEHWEQFGAVRAKIMEIDRASLIFERFGFAEASRLTLEHLLKQATELDGQSARRPIVNPETISMARVFVPALTRLAGFKIRKGQTDEASRLLDSAAAIATAKMKEASVLGGRAKLLALRDLAPALHLIAQYTGNVVAPDGSGRVDSLDRADRLFQAMQTALQSELSVTVEAANRRRFFSDPVAESFVRQYASDAALAARLSDLPKTYESHFADGGEDKNLDVDFVLSKAADESRRTAESSLKTLMDFVPQLAGLSDDRIAPLAQASAGLHPGTALVLLRAGETRLQGMMVEPGNTARTWQTDISRGEIERLVKSIRDSTKITESDPPDFPLDDAARLYQAIFGPVIRDLSRIRKLQILADGPFQSLPYGALVTAQPSTSKLKAREARSVDVPWLIRSHAVTVLPSISSPAAKSALASSKAQRPFVGIGNPRLAPVQIAQRNLQVGDVFANTASGLANIKFLKSVSSLPETEDELRQIGRSLGAGDDSIIVQDAATEPNVRTMDLSRYRIVAFATHGALAGEVKGSSEPGLILTPPEVASTHDDGFLALSEIADLKLDADLVILSACNTAAGDDRPRAESLSGLARAFIGAGARSLFVTHWAIPSDSAVKITTGAVDAKLADAKADWSDALRASSLAVIDREGPVEWPIERAFGL